MRNNNSCEDHVLQNQFTAYLVTAIRRKKSKFISGKENLKCEVSLENQVSELQVDMDLLADMPVIEQLENERLIRALLGNRERSIYIFLERAIQKRAFNDIAESLGMSYRSVTMAYYRVLRKLRKELGDGR